MFPLKQACAVDIVFASNCFCHIPNLIEILVTLARWDTTIIFEDPYLGSIIEGVTYDQFYDEHVFYFGVNSVSNMAQKVGLALVDVVRLPVHGGSIRYTLRKSDEVFNHNELWANQNRVYDSLSSAIRQSKNRLIGGIRGIENLAGYGATSKSTTILNYCGLDWRRIKYIVDSTPQKQGKLTPEERL